MLGGEEIEDMNESNSRVNWSMPRQQMPARREGAGMVAALGTPAGARRRRKGPCLGLRRKGGRAAPPYPMVMPTYRLPPLKRLPR